MPHTRLPLMILTMCLVVAANVTAQTKPTKPGAAASVPAAMTNADVVKMVKAGLGEALVVASIRNAERHAFDLRPDGLVALKTAGVSDASST